MTTNSEPVHDLLRAIRQGLGVRDLVLVVPEPWLARLDDLPAEVRLMAGDPKAEAPRDRVALHGGSVQVQIDPGTAPKVTPPVVALVEALGALLSVGDELRQTRARVAELDQLTLRDPLTGLGNRRLLERTLPYELSRRLRYQRALTLMLLDLDHFKLINDNHGHDVGDRVLRAVADALKNELRRADLALRYGGEEFAVLLPETAVEGAYTVAERIRRAVACLDVSGIEVTVSIGLASVEGRWEGDQAALVRAADQALYRAKRAGRNQVVMSNLMEGSIEGLPHLLS